MFLTNQGSHMKPPKQAPSIDTYLGTITEIGLVSVKVEFGDRTGHVYMSKIPGYYQGVELSTLCKVGDRMRVRIATTNPKTGLIMLDCIEFPVE